MKQLQNFTIEINKIFLYYKLIRVQLITIIVTKMKVKKTSCKAGLQVMISYNKK